MNLHEYSTSDLPSAYESLPQISRRTYPIPKLNLNNSVVAMSDNKRSDYYNSIMDMDQSTHLHTSGIASHKMLHRDISQIQVESQLSQRSDEVQGFTGGVKQMKLFKKMKQHSDLRTKYLGEDSKMSHILSSARIQQQEMKKRLKANQSALL